MKTMTADRLRIEIHPDRTKMGNSAAARAADLLRAAVAAKGAARIIVASAPSQDELLAELTVAPGIDWTKVTVFHMDEYVGLGADHPSSFRAYQKQHLLAKVKPAAFHGIRGEAPRPQAECARYASLLAEAPIDLVCMGIGENGHIAFNDPPVANFSDPNLVNVVQLDEACRRQQVNDQCFPDFASVPTHALSLSCPALMAGKALVCVVPGPLKAAAVRAAVNDPVSTACPATILRRHPDATLFLDADSADLL